MKRFLISTAKRPSRLAPIALPLVLVGLTTVALMALEIYVDAQRLIFFYLVPTTLVAVAYGSTAGTFTAIVSALTAAYFIYPPTFTLFVEDPLHDIELAFFAVLAFAASHIVGQMSAWRNDD